ncbi:MAG: hydrogenase formation protein HypD [Eubacteriales bacterium]
MNDFKINKRLNACLSDVKNEIRIMEVCGTHTQAISKSGIRHILPSEVMLLSGPGCPVCVTQETYIDTAAEILSKENVILATFGDMLKVRGSKGSLADINSRNVITVYSPSDAVEIAVKNKEKTVVFAAVGFETTAPLFAALIKNNYENGPGNLYFLTALKRMEPVLRLILEDERKRIDGIICPGHVAAVLGANAFRFITDEYNIPAVICCFDTIHITEGVCSLIEQITQKKPPSFLNLYNRCVSAGGNEKAQQYMKEVFETADTKWRGIGIVKDSALVINKKYEKSDAKKRFGIKEKNSIKTNGCACSEIILGIKTPQQCIKFGKSCTPRTPQGPCMVSSEGACAIHYRYGREYENDR